LWLPFQKPKFAGKRRTTLTGDCAAHNGGRASGRRAWSREKNLINTKISSQELKEMTAHRESTEEGQRLDPHTVRETEKL
jgi:hypothetical protein